MYTIRPDDIEVTILDMKTWELQVRTKTPQAEQVIETARLIEGCDDPGRFIARITVSAVKKIPARSIHAKTKKDAMELMVAEAICIAIKEILDNTPIH